MIHGFILTISSYEKEPKQIILDFDDSNSNAYGNAILFLDGLNELNG